jgi:hypothetical protein
MKIRLAKFSQKLSSKCLIKAQMNSLKTAHLQNSLKHNKISKFWSTKQKLSD